MEKYDRSSVKVSRLFDRRLAPPVLNVWMKQHVQMSESLERGRAEQDYQCARVCVSCSVYFPARQHLALDRRHNGKQMEVRKAPCVSRCVPMVALKTWCQIKVWGVSRLTGSSLVLSQRQLWLWMLGSDRQPR